MSQFNFEDYVLKNTSIRRNSLGFALLYFAYFIPLDGWILITYVVFLLIGLSELHLINLGYVLIVLIALLIHQYSSNVWSKVRIFWLFVVTYCTLAFGCLYAVQYDFIDRWLRNSLYPKHWNNTYISLEDIGLTRKDKTNLFVILSTMIGPVLALINSFLQFSVFLKDNRLQIKTNVYVKQAIHYFNQTLYFGQLHIAKLFVIFIFIFIVRRVSLISLLYLIFIVSLLPFRSLLDSLWAPMGVLSTIVLICRYIFQLHYFRKRQHDINWIVVGFHRWGHTLSDPVAPQSASLAESWKGLGEELTIL
ncbi:hypothetical protein RFI_38716, partial [Reticulomyxa filosa]